jgi:hypothetical protein
MKLLATLVGLLFSLLTFGQIKNAVVLKWKISPNEILSYKTLMKEIDTANLQDLSIDFGGLFNMINDSSDGKASHLNKLFSDLNKSFAENDLTTKLTTTNKGLIDITMYRKKKVDKLSQDKDTSGINNKSSDVAKMITGDVVLRGAIYDNGSIQSFYVKNDQKNLIALFFELPNKQLKIGDTWSLDVNLISTDQNFKCDTSFRKNVVTLIDLKKVGNETIAVIKYDIMEFVLGVFNNPLARNSKETMMKMKYNAIAEFSIEKGRWSSYDGIMSLTSSGFVKTNSMQKFALLKP